ncbi:MAG: ParB N-terminal domain-containing protein [Bacteroidetes bacterium]|nr:ParB N-terminal domain-containing protein [Bacteroidota bacterium]
MVEYPEMPEEDDDELEEEEMEELAPVNELINVPLYKLRIHKLSRTIYRERKNSKEIKWMAENMRLVGQLEPIIINRQYVILSGVRRYYAALKLGLPELRAIVNDVYDELKEVEVIVSHNKQRVKTPLQIINEVEAILGILGKNQGRRNDLLKSDKSNPYGKIGGDRFEIAATITDSPLSASSLRRLISVSDFEKESQENKNLGLVDKIFKKEMSPYRASILVKDFKKQKEEREKAKIKRTERKSTQTDSSEFKIYNKSSNIMNEVKSGSVQVVFTSPPYWNLRNYGLKTKGEMPLGLERTAQEFIQALSIHFRDVRRVLSDKGSFFLNIGDTYRVGENYLIPPRLLLNLCDNEGWFMVNEIIWKKSTGVPQGKTKRLQPIYEKVFHLVKDPDEYYYQEFKNWKESDEINLVKMPGSRNAQSTKKNKGGYILSKTYERFRDFLDEQTVRNVIFGSTASIRQMELKKLDVMVDHLALMPLYLPIIPILTTSREGDIILDPFSGSGTVGKTALIFGRKYIGFELNEEFSELSIRDLNNTVELLAKDTSKKDKKKLSSKRRKSASRYDPRSRGVHRKGPGSKK